MLKIDRYENLHKAAISAGQQSIVDGIIFDELGRILVLKRAKNRQFLPDCWDLPGGHVQKGETLAVALAREIKEETGWVLLEIRDLLMAWDWQPEEKNRKEQYKQFDFVVTVERERSTPKFDSREFSNYYWVSESKANIVLANRHSGDRWILDVIQCAFSWRRRDESI